MRSRIFLLLTAISLLGYGCGETTGNNDGGEDGGVVDDGGVNDGGTSNDGGGNPGPTQTTFESLMEANEALHETICYCDYYRGHYCEAAHQEVLPLLADEEACVDALYAQHASTVDPWVDCQVDAWVEAADCYEDEECGRHPKGLPPSDGGSDGGEGGVDGGYVDCEEQLADALDACPSLPEAVVSGYEDCVAADEESAAETAFLAMRTLCISCEGPESASECKMYIDDESLECMQEGVMYILDDYEPEDPQEMLNCLQETFKRAMLCFAQGCDEGCLGIFYDAQEECGVDAYDMEEVLFECSGFFD